MGIDLSRFKVIHGGMVLNAVALMEVQMPDDMDYSNRDTVVKPRFIDVLAINRTGTLYLSGMKHGPFSLSRLSQSSRAAVGHTVNGSEYGDDLY